MQFNLSPERVKEIKLWILIPTRELRSLSPHHVTLLGTLRQHGIWYSLRTLPGDSLVTRARNNLASIFYRESTDDENHFSLWLDDDIYFNPESVLQMLFLNLDFVSAPYTKKGLHMDRIHAAATLGWKSEDIVKVAGTPNVNWITPFKRIDEPVPVLESGSGFWLIKRKVFRQMVENLDIEYKRTNEEKAHYGSDTAHDFFRVGIWPETKEYLSEDWWFSREWRNLGGTVWCCFWIKTFHLGPYMYPMDMDMTLGLLNTTGGYINGPTWAKERLNNGGQKVNGSGEAGPIEENEGTLGKEETGSRAIPTGD